MTEPSPSQDQDSTELLRELRDRLKQEGKRRRRFGLWLLRRLR